MKHSKKKLATQAAIAIAMKKAGKKPKKYQEGGRPSAGNRLRGAAGCRADAAGVVSDSRQLSAGHPPTIASLSPDRHSPAIGPARCHHRGSGRSVWTDPQRDAATHRSAAITHHSRFMGSQSHRCRRWLDHSPRQPRRNRTGFPWFRLGSPPITGRHDRRSTTSRPGSGRSRWNSCCLETSAGGGGFDLGQPNLYGQAVT